MTTEFKLSQWNVNDISDFGYLYHVYVDSVADVSEVHVFLRLMVEICSVGVLVNI
jgi:hypothetical protein